MILTSVAMAQQPAQPKASPQSPAAAGGKPGVVVADVIEVRAKVDAVDYDKRLVTLTGPHTVVVKAGPQVRNLDQIKAGDQLVIRHLESVALFVRKSGEPPHASEVAVVEVAAKGQKPGGIMVDTVEVTGRVEAIDYAKRKLTLIGPGGKAKTVKVDPAVKRFKEVKKGDEVVLRHTEAFAIAVRKP
jgi:hypothetical protein